jgi:hypothetical protein
METREWSRALLRNIMCTPWRHGVHRNRHRRTVTGYYRPKTRKTNVEVFSQNLFQFISPKRKMGNPGMPPNPTGGLGPQLNQRSKPKLHRINQGGTAHKLLRFAKISNASWLPRIQLCIEIIGIWGKISHPNL